MNELYAQTNCNILGRIYLSATFTPPSDDTPSSVTKAVLSTEVMPLIGISPVLERQDLATKSKLVSFKVGQRPWVERKSNKEEEEEEAEEIT
jgi:hypothetical protein